jgi:hypothetical protein
MFWVLQWTCKGLCESSPFAGGIQGVLRSVQVWGNSRFIHSYVVFTS